MFPGKSALPSFFTRRHLHHGIAITLLTTAAPCFASNNFDAWTEFDIAMDAQIRQDRTGTLNHLNTAIKLDPKNTRFLETRARFLAEYREFSLALNDLNKLLKLSPGDVAAIRLRASIQTWQKNQKQALEDYSTILKANPEDVDALWKRAGISEALGQTQSAQADLSTLGRLGYDKQAIYVLSHYMAMMSAGRFDEALHLLNDAAARAPKCAELDGAAARILEEQLEYAAAASRYNLARAKATKNTTFWLDMCAGRAENESRLEHFAIALADIQNLINARNPKGAYISRGDWSIERLKVPLEIRANIYAAKGDYLKAIESLSLSLALHTGAPRAMRLKRAGYLIKLKQYQAAIADADAIINSMPQPWDAYPTRYDGYMGLKNYQAALADATAVIKHSPDDPDSLSKRYSALMALSRYADAVKDMTEAIDIDNSARFYKARAEAYRKLGNKNLAERDELTARNISAKRLQ